MSASDTFAERMRAGSVSSWELADLLGIHPHLLPRLGLGHLREQPVKVLLDLARRLDLDAADLLAALDPAVTVERPEPGPGDADALVVLAALNIAHAPLSVDPARRPRPPGRPGDRPGALPAQPRQGRLPPGGPPRPAHRCRGPRDEDHRHAHRAAARPRRSPDDTKIAYANSGGGLFTMNPDGSGKTQLYASGNAPQPSDWAHAAADLSVVLAATGSARR